VRTVAVFIALAMIGEMAGAATSVRGTIRGSDGDPRLIGRVALLTDAQSQPILPTKQELYVASQSAPMEKVAADGSFELTVPPGHYALFAFADLNGNGRWDPGIPEPMGWHTAEAAGDTTPVNVAEEDIEGIEIELKVPTPFPREEQLTEGGSLRWIKGYPVLRLKGDAHTRGYAHGKLAAAQIVDFFRFYVLEEKTKSAKVYEEGFAKFLQTNFAWPKEMVTECEALIEGMKASGADLRIPELGRDFSLVDLYAINGYIETRAMASHCTQFAAWGERTTGTDVEGGMITGRNMDGEIDIRRVTVSHFLIVAVEPSEPGQKRYVSMMWPGFVATISGINEAGFYTMENAGLTGPGPVVDKLVPFSWTMRQALVTQGADATPSGVQQLIDSFDNSAGGSCGPGCITLFATPYNGQRNPAWVHEGDRFGDAIRTAGEAEPRIPQVLVASNHPRKYGVDRLRPDWVFDIKPSYSSLWRYEAGRHKLEGWHRTDRKIGTPEMQELLQTVAHGTTEYSVVTRPNAREFDVAVASLKAELWDAPYRQWTTFKFDEVFEAGTTSTAAR
jgi:hypothetical protein